MQNGWSNYNKASLFTLVSFVAPFGFLGLAGIVFARRAQNGAEARERRAARIIQWMATFSFGMWALACTYFVTGSFTTSW